MMQERAQNDNIRQGVWIVFEGETEYLCKCFQEYKVQTDPSGRYADYNMLGGGNPAVGVCHARGGNVGLPLIWMLYLPVGDLAESLRRVEQGGGKIIKETMETDMVI